MAEHVCACYGDGGGCGGNESNNGEAERNVEEGCKERIKGKRGEETDVNFGGIRCKRVDDKFREESRKLDEKFVNYLIEKDTKSVAKSKSNSDDDGRNRHEKCKCTCKAEKIAEKVNRMMMSEPLRRMAGIAGVVTVAAVVVGLIGRKTGRNKRNN